MSSLSNSKNVERVLLKQITDLTRQVEAQKKLSQASNSSHHFVPQSSGYRTTNYRHKTLALPQKVSRKWSKPAASGNVSSESKPFNGPSLPLDAPSTGILKRVDSSQDQSVKRNKVYMNPNFAQASHATSLSTVHVNPNKGIGSAANVHVNQKKPVCITPHVASNVNSTLPKHSNVHVNPNFAGRLALPSTAAAKEETSSSSRSSPMPKVLIQSITPPLISLPNSKPGKCDSSQGFTSAPSHTSLGSDASTAYSSQSATAASTSSSVVKPAMSPKGMSKRRRSRSLSSRYRLRTHRKLIRRLSSENGPVFRSSPGEKSQSGTALHKSKHKLVRNVVMPKPKLTPNMTTTGVNRFKLIRNTAGSSQVSGTFRHKSPRIEPLLASKCMSARTGSHHRTLKRTQLALQRVAMQSGTSGSYDNLATPGAKTPKPATQHRTYKRTLSVSNVRSSSGSKKRGLVESSNRVWRRRNSSGSGQGLMSMDLVKLGPDRFVNIGGIVYRSSRRKLQRTGSSPKTSGRTPGRSNKLRIFSATPRSVTVRGVRYRVEAGGRSLRRMTSRENAADAAGAATPTRRLDIGGLTYRTTADGGLVADRRQQANRQLRSRAKSRSLAVLRDWRAVSLSRKPCTLYCRTGRCTRHERRLCPHVHRADLRPVCTGHLTPAGCRRGDQCTFNHAPAPEKLPMCLHFLNDECRRDACPYPHVYVDPEAPLCAQFLTGYCPLAQKCANKHFYICPEFSFGQQCPRGADCPLLHRTRRRRHLSQSRARHLQPAAETTAKLAPPRGRARYYQSAAVAASPDSEAGELENQSSQEEAVSRPRRKSMGEMPSFIRLDSSSGED